MADRDITYPVAVRDDELTGELSFAGETSALTLPKGTTGQRPSPAVNGQIRYNDTTSEFEAYENGSWVAMIGDPSAFYISTMSPSNTGTQNATALVADVTAAAGRRILVQTAGTYTLNAVVLSGVTFNIEFANGVTLVPDSAGGLYLSGKMFQLTSCNTTMRGLNVNGNTNGSPIMVRADGGTFRAYNTTMTGVGPSSGSASTVGVYGFLLVSCTVVIIDGYVGTNFRDIPNGTYGDTPGTVRHIFLYKCTAYSLENLHISSGGDGDDVDYIQFLDDQATPTMVGTIKNATLLYSHRIRRCIKFQGGYHFAENLDIRPGSDFVKVSTPTAVSGAANNGSGLIRLTVASADHIQTGQRVAVSGVTGTTEANGTWIITKINATTIDLQGSTFTNAYVSGGTVSPNGTLITGAANNGSGLIRLTVNSTTNFATGNQVTVSGVTGTTEANGTWLVTVINGTTMDLQASTFTNAYVSGGLAIANTDVGANCLNAVDWAANLAGFARIDKSRFDFTGYALGATNSNPSGENGRIILENSELVGSALSYIRINPENPLSNQNSPTLAFYSSGSDAGSGMENCVVKGFGKGAALQGGWGFLRGNTFDDPRDLAWENGTSTQKTSQDVINNKVITRTPGYLTNAGGFCARLNNTLDVRYFNNSLIQAGNTTHNSIFISATDSSATGRQGGNTAPLSVVPFYVSSQSNGILNLDINALHVNPSAVGNVGTGEDDLQTFTLQPNQLGLRGFSFGAMNYRGVSILQQGTFANNANAKTLKLYLGGTLVRTETLPTSIAGSWRYEIDIVSTSATAQDYVGKAMITDAAGVVQTYLFRGTLTLTAANTQIVKCTGEATSNNDIVSELQKIVSY